MPAYSPMLLALNSKEWISAPGPNRARLLDLLDVCNICTLEIMPCCSVAPFTFYRHDHRLTLTRPRCQHSSQGTLRCPLEPIRRSQPRSHGRLHRRRHEQLCRDCRCWQRGSCWEAAQAVALFCAAGAHQYGSWGGGHSVWAAGAKPCALYCVCDWRACHWGCIQDGAAR